jgi:K+-transporting ATPase c subunit
MGSVLARAATHRVPDGIGVSRPVPEVDSPRAATGGRALGFIGEERVNVLALNLALEQTPAAWGSASPTVSDPVGG